MLAERQTRTTKTAETRSFLKITQHQKIQSMVYSILDGKDTKITTGSNNNNKNNNTNDDPTNVYDKHNLDPSNHLIFTATVERVIPIEYQIEP